MRIEFGERPAVHVRYQHVLTTSGHIADAVRCSDVIDVEVRRNVTEYAAVGDIDVHDAVVAIAGKDMVVDLLGALSDRSDVAEPQPFSAVRVERHHSQPARILGVVAVAEADQHRRVISRNRGK
ncbi:hypothetical protein [Rhodococcus sp. G-MC3]|uniref:hypothetical protein n=1 Tax=Rhodococcus sp. G-MC3 TaxID=3046209 RepID=UPI003FA728DE